MWKSLILPLLAAVSPAGSAQAADEVNVSTGGTLAGPGLAAMATTRAKRTSASKANPGKYAPAYGGFCAYGAALGKKFDGDPRYWKIVDGKLYLNLNGDIQAEWSKDIPGNLAKADTNWGRIHGVAATRL